MNPYFISQIKMFNFIILYFIISYAYSNDTLIYPSAITLPNDNIFIIHKLGVYKYNSSFEKPEEIIPFKKEEEQIKEEDLSKLTIRYDEKNNYIICLIKEKIYLFDDKGNSLYKSNNKIINNTQNIDYYLIVSATEVKNDTHYYYVIGFIDNNNYLNLKLYNYNKEQKNNTLISENTFKNFKFSKKDNTTEDNLEFKIKSLSCEYMKYNIKNTNLLVCFIVYPKNSSTITTTYYTINNMNQIENIDLLNKDNEYYHKLYSGLTINLNNKGDINIIKSSLLEDRTMATVYFQNILNETFYAKFNITSQEFTNGVYLNKTFRNNSYGLKVDYFPQNDQIVYSCLVNNSCILINFESNNNKSNNKSIYMFPSCENIFGYSIIYLNSIKKYYILSDVMCNNTNHPFIEIGKEEEEKEETPKYPDFCIEYDKNNKTNCTKCEDGYYLDGVECKKCNDNCHKCKKGIDKYGNTHCESCKKNSINKYLIMDEKNSKCVEVCPNRTIFQEINGDGFCFKNCSEEYYKYDSDCQKSDSTFITIFIIVLVLIVICNLALYGKKLFNKKKKNDEKLTNDNYSELPLTN